jgi:AcrR family transcriptional regulator
MSEDGLMEAPAGRRELAKDATRRTIRRSAMALFLERGFDHVTTAEVAASAGVSPATLFNYFATKEDLFFGQVEQLERELVDAVMSCVPDHSILDVLRMRVLYELTAGRAYTDPASVGPFHRQVGASPRLLAREAEIYQRREVVLTGALDRALGDRSDRLAVRVAAAVYIAAERTVATELRQRLEKKPTVFVVRGLQAYVDEVFAVLRTGVGELIPTAPPDEGRPTG